MGGPPCSPLASVESRRACRQHLPCILMVDAAGNAACGGMAAALLFAIARIARRKRRLVGRALRPARHILRLMRAAGGHWNIAACGRRLCFALWWLSARRWPCTPRNRHFCLPLLPVALLPLLPRAQWRRAIAASLALGSVCAILFAYRWWALGGIGGYADRTGVSTIWRIAAAAYLGGAIFPAMGLPVFSRELVGAAGVVAARGRCWIPRNAGCYAARVGGLARGRAASLLAGAGVYAVPRTYRSTTS